MSTSSNGDSAFPRVLPDETLTRVASLLLGVELLALSHASSATLETFSREALWRSRVDPALLAASDSSALTSKQRYLRACTSFAFPGRAQAHAAASEPVGAFMRVCSTMRDAFGSWGQPFSFELCFSIASGDDNASLHAGGVLFGAQSVRIVRATVMEPSLYAQLVYVDAQRNLFCSVIQSMQHEAPVALALAHSRWYHLALVYTGANEHVYLDGELIKTVDGPIPLEWRRLYAAQVGTGFIAPDSVAAAYSPTVTGWHGFHGVLDNLRVYRYALSTMSVQRLRIGAPITDDDDEGEGEGDTSDTDVFDAAVFSMKRDARGARHCLKRICCSRPRERWCQSLAVDARAESLERLLELA